MLKNITQLEHIIEGKAYKFLCDIDSNIPAIKDALFEFMKFVGQIEDKIKAKQAEESAKQPQPEVPANSEIPSVSASPIIEEQKIEEVKAE